MTIYILIFSMISKSSATSNIAALPRHTAIVDNLHNIIALTKSRRKGGRLRSLGSLANRSSSSSVKRKFLKNCFFFQNYNIFYSKIFFQGQSKRMIMNP